MLCDVGAGNGDTTHSVLHAINRNHDAKRIVPFCKFYLLDPSGRVQTDAVERIKSVPLQLQKIKNYKIDEETFQEEFERTRDGFYHIVYSTAVFHHFTMAYYLELINRKLRDPTREPSSEGVLISADWFTHVWSNPAYIVAILQEMGADNSKINRFRSGFNVGSKNWQQVNYALPETEQQANIEMINFIVKLAREMEKLPKDLRLPFLEAHETLEDRLGKMKRSNFDVSSELRKSHGSNIIQVFPKSSIGQVIIAKKKRKALTQTF
jgi:hypothetical protein